MAGACLLLWVGPADRVGARAADDESPGLTLEAEGGIEGWTMPGREYPVRVTIGTDRLLTGVVRVHAPGTTGETLVEREVEVSGGSTARVDLVMPAWPADGLGDEGRVDLVVDGEVAARAGFDVQQHDPDEELVGLLPDAVATGGGADALPARVPLAVDLGTARPLALDADLLELGSLALEPLDQLVAAPAELAALPAGHRAAVTAWVQAGGQLLLVGDDLDAAEAALPDGWLPEAGTGVRAGLGQVRAVGDDWTEGLLPSPTRTVGEDADMAASDLFTSPVPMTSELGEAAGLRLPGGRALALLLGAYVVLAGPAAFLLLRRLHRRQLAWAAIPLLAVGSTGVVFTTGSSLRRSLSSAQVTVYETGPAGTVATTWSLLANKDGGEVGVTLPEGWTAGGGFEDAMAFSGPIVVRRGAGVVFRGDPADDPGDGEVRVTSGVGGADAEALVSSPVAGYGTVQARGPVTGMDDALVVTASSDADGVIHGTVRNRLDVALQEVAVFAGHMGVVDVGTLGAGEQREFTIEDATAFTWGQAVEPTVWPQPDTGDVGVMIQPAPGGGKVIVGGGNGDAQARKAREEAVAVAVVAGPAGDAQPQPPKPVPPTPPVAGKPGAGGVIVDDGSGGRDGTDAGSESPVVMGAWAATQGRVGWNYRPTGQVVAAGWTDELDAPVTPSSGAGPARSSRSAVVARATVTPAGGRLTDAAVVRSLVRGPADESNAGGDQLGGGTWAFFLPPAVDGRPVDTSRLVLNQRAGFDRPEFWTPDGWVGAEVPATGQTEIAVPPAAVVDGVVVYRWADRTAGPVAGARDTTIYEKEAPR